MAPPFSSNAQQKRILITGIPGTGKTFLREKLKSKKGFIHIEIETHPDIHRLLHKDPTCFVRNFIDGEGDIVLTFGFNPRRCHKEIIFLMNQEFKLIWLDGNRNFAYNAYRNRNKNEDPNNLQHHLDNFKLQIKEINETGIIKKIAPIIIDTFNADGSFRGSDEILKDIL